MGVCVCHIYRGYRDAGRGGRDGKGEGLKRKLGGGEARGGDVGKMHGGGGSRVDRTKEGEVVYMGERGCTGVTGTVSGALRGGVSQIGGTGGTKEGQEEGPGGGRVGRYAVVKNGHVRTLWASIRADQAPPGVQRKNTPSLVIFGGDYMLWGRRERATWPISGGGGVGHQALHEGGAIGQRRRELKCSYRRDGVETLFGVFMNLATYVC